MLRVAGSLFRRSSGISSIHEPNVVGRKSRPDHRRGQGDRQGNRRWTFARAGADVALVSRTAGDVEAVSAELRGVGRRALACPADVNDIAALPSVVERVVAELGGLDILVNCAGGGYHWHSFDDTSVEMVEEQFHFTVTSVFALTKAAVPHLLAASRRFHHQHRIGDYRQGKSGTSRLRDGRKRRWCS